jgi:hypothetical protein
LYISQTLIDGSVVVSDADDPNVSYVLKPGQAEELLALPESEQRHRLREILIANRAGSDPRDELTRTIAENESQGQGERHEMQEEAQ